MSKLTTALLVAAALPLLCSSALAQDAGYTGKLKFYSLGDCSIYTKSWNDLDSHWKQDVGITGLVAAAGRFRLRYSFAYLQQYPLKDKVLPMWSTYGMISYSLTNQSVEPALYTKTKSNLEGLWQQETGIMVKLYKSGHLTIVNNYGYVVYYPFLEHPLPHWQAAVSFQYSLK